MTDSCKLSSDFLTCALAPILLQVNKQCPSVSEQKWSQWETVILKGIRVVAGAASCIVFPRQKEALELLGLSGRTPFSTVGCQGRNPDFQSSLVFSKAVRIQGDDLSAALLEHLAGVRVPVLTMLSSPLLGSAQLSPLLARENWWLLFQAVPCRWSLPSLANFHLGREVRSIITGYCCWYLLCYPHC